MTKTYLETVEEIFSDLNGANEGKIDVLIEETTKYLTDLKERFESDEAEVREKALNSAVEVQAGLQKQVEALLQKAGIGYNDLAALLNTSLAKDQNELLRKAEEGFSGVFPKEKEEERAPKTFKKTNKIKLVG